jgi:hypothetical protein
LLRLPMRGGEGWAEEGRGGGEELQQAA